MNREEVEKILQQTSDRKKCYDTQVPTLLQQLKPFHAKNGKIRAYYDYNMHYVVKVNDMEILRMVKSAFGTRCYFNDTRYKGSGSLGYYQQIIKNYILRCKEYTVHTMTDVAYGYACRIDRLYRGTH